MLAVILAYDQLLFRPLVAWSARFQTDDGATLAAPDPWVLVLLRRTHLLRRFCLRVGDGLTRIGWLALGPRPPPRTRAHTPPDGCSLDCRDCRVRPDPGVENMDLFPRSLQRGQVLHVMALGGLTLLRVMITVLVASVIWVPAGIWLGLSPRRARHAQMAAQFMAAFPANLFFPLVVVAIVHWHLNSNIWLTPLMLLGTQWYILFNIVAGASSYPGDLLEAARNFHVRGWLWWRRVMLPGITPYFITGALTASGGA